MDRILATHTGSLIRPPELLAFLAAKERGQELRRGGLPEDACAPPLTTSSTSRSRWGSTCPTTARWARPAGSRTCTSGSAGSRSARSSSRAGPCIPRVGTARRSPAPIPRWTRSRTPASTSRTPPPRARCPTRRPRPPAKGVAWVCTGPLTYDRAAVDRDIANFKAALAEHEHDIVDGFLPVVAPASAYWLLNEYYAGEEEFMFALADALARGVPGDRRRRAAGPGRRRGDDARGGHDDVARAVVGRLPPVGRPARARAQPRARGPARGPRPLPRVLGQLARPACVRPGAQGRGRPDPGRERRRPTSWSRPTPGTSTSGGCGRKCRCPRARS